VVAPTGRHETLVQQRLEIDVRLLAADEVEPEIGLPAGHGLQHLVGIGIQDPDPDLRVDLVVAADHLRQEVVHRRRHAGDAHLAHARGRHAPDAQQRRVQVVEQVVHLAREVAAHGGERHAARRAVQQPHAQGVLQLLDAAAERRLRQVDRLGRLAEILQLRHRAEGQQVVEVEVEGHGERFRIDAFSLSIDPNNAIHTHRSEGDDLTHAPDHPPLCPDARRHLARPVLPSRLATGRRDRA